MDSFFDEIKKDSNLRDEIGDLMAIMKDVANNKLLPKGKFRKLKGKKNQLSCFEAKSKNLRLYSIKEGNIGRILIIGGKKKTQSKDIFKLEKIVKEYQTYKK